MHALDQEVRFPANGVSFAGTLALSESGAARAAVVFISGGNADFEIVVVPRSEHFFRDMELSEERFAPGFLEMLTDWIVERA